MPQTYIIAIPLGMAERVDIVFDAERLIATARTYDTRGDYYEGKPAGPIADLVGAYLRTWLFSPRADLDGHYRPQPWVDREMWLDTFLDRLETLCDEGFADREVAHDAA